MAMSFLVGVFLVTCAVSTTADVERKSVSPVPVLEPKEGGTQTINTAPITIHIPLPKSHATSEPSDAPTAIASETPEGTYLIPVTQQSKPDAPPAVNLVLNLRLLLDGERKPEQSEASTVVTDRTPKPAVNGSPGEYVAHEVNIVTPSANLNSAPTQEGGSSSPPAGLSAGVVQSDISAASPSQVNSPREPHKNYEVKIMAPKANLNSVATQLEEASTSPPSGLSAGVGGISAASTSQQVNSPSGSREPQNNYGIGPSFLLVPKRRVLHNVRSNVKANVPGIPLVKFRQQILSGHNIKRLLHGVPPLTEDQKLDGEAQSFAAKLASQGSLTHSPLKDRLGKGENIALRCSFGGSPLTGARATNLWYGERKRFNWKFRSLTPATERFTQLVWKNTSKVGFGTAQFKDKVGRTCFVVVARYEPAGNERGKLMDNVFKPSEHRHTLRQ